LHNHADSQILDLLTDRNYRFVIMREKTGDPQLDLFEGENSIIIAENYQKMLIYMENSAIFT